MTNTRINLSPLKDRNKMNDEEVAKRIAEALVDRRGFGWYDNPMEGGQDAYDICQ
jgi:hypothetical protein